MSERVRGNERGLLDGYGIDREKDGLILDGAAAVWSIRSYTAGLAQ